MTSPSDAGKPGSGKLGCLAVILGLTAASTFIILSTGGELSSAKHPDVVATTAIASGQAEGKAAQPVTMPIVPAEAIDPNPTYFIGTGDRSNGSWTQP